jgi:hypothetical protein
VHRTALSERISMLKNKPILRGDNGATLAARHALHVQARARNPARWTRGTRTGHPTALSRSIPNATLWPPRRIPSKKYSQLLTTRSPTTLSPELSRRAPNK